MAMKFVLTNKGLELKAKIEAGAVLNFTKVETGDIYSPIPEELQSVPNARQVLDIDSIIVNDDTATVKIILSNLENTEEYYIKQLGLYASDPDTGYEILYIIGQDSIGERVPAITDMQVEYEFDVNIKAGNAASIRFEVNGEAFLRKKQFQAFLEDEFYPHINDKEIHHKHDNKKLLNTVTNIFTEQSTLTALRSGDTLPTLLSKTAKAISSLISHIVLMGTASVLGHVKLSDTYASKIVNGTAANGLGASQNALYNAYNKLNTDLGNLQAGKVDLLVRGNNYITYTVKFPKQYVSSPAFVASAGHASKATMYITVHNISGAGAKITVSNLTSTEGTFTINWIAFPVT